MKTRHHAMTDRPYRVAIYARVSTDDQKCDLQLAELRRYVNARGWQPAVEYIDTGFSGMKTSRPALDRCMIAARKREFDCVLVWKLDRWGRGVQHCISSIQDLRSMGVRFMDLQGIDTDQSSPIAQFLFHIMAAFAQLERDMIRERVKAGMKAAKHRGVQCGRPRVVVDRVRARELRKAGASIREIAKTLGIGRGTAERLLAA